MKKMSDWEIYQLARHKPRDAQELDFYCKAIFNMDIPKERSGYCKRHCRQCDPPFEALKSAYFAETPECGWIGGRGTSKTVMIALLTSIELLTLEIDVSIISGSKDQSSLILKYMRNQDTTLRGKLWGAQNAPKWLFNEREDAKYRLRTVEDRRDKDSVGNEIIAHAAAESSIRGSHPCRARLDECLHFNTDIMTSCGTKRVCDLQPEDIVYGWNGTRFVPVPVDRVWCTGIKPTIRFDFEDGTYIEVTGNHPILTDGGWMYAENIAKIQEKRDTPNCTDHQPKEPLVVGSATLGCPTVTYKRITRVSDGSTAPVYDVALRHTHNFVANGIVVHNCDLADFRHIETARGLPTEDLTRPDVRTHILYASTYHIYNGTMSKLIKELRGKGFPVFAWCVFEQLEENGGFITRRYLADKMRTLGKIKWDIEYMNNGPIAGIPILDAEMLNHRYDTSLGYVPGLPNIPWELTDTPSKMTRHYHGIDWAKAEHWTVFDTLIRAEKGFQQGAWYRTGRKPWPDISRDAARHIHRFLGPVAHDATGVGAAMDDWLVEHRVPRSRIMGVNWRKTTLIKEMATAYVGALQSGDIVGPSIEFARSEHEYLTEAMLYDDEHCPDSVAAAMMAYWVARQNNRRTSPRPMRIKVQ